MTKEERFFLSVQLKKRCSTKIFIPNIINITPPTILAVLL